MTVAIRERVAVLLQHIRPVQIDAADARDPAKRLCRDLGLDQIDLMTLDLELEDRFGLTLGEDALLALKTVGDLVIAVTDHVSAGASFTPPGTAGALLRVAPAPADPLFIESGGIGQ